MITLTNIEQQTREYAATRRAALDQAAQVQSEIDAVRAKHAKSLRKRVQRMTEAHGALFERIASFPELFPEGSKSITFDGIKVGYQKGKDKLVVKDDESAIRVLRTLIQVATTHDQILRLEAAIKTTHKLVDSGVKRLTMSEMTEIGAVLTPAIDSVLVMPQEDDSTRAVDALIKAAQVDIADGE